MFRSRFLVSPRVGRLHLTFSTKSYDIKKVGIVGLGLMGHGIAQITAQAGYKVLAIETNQEAIDRGMKRFQIISYLALDLCLSLISDILKN